MKESPLLQIVRLIEFIIFCNINTKGGKNVIINT